jgi:hypothetical protein
LEFDLEGNAQCKESGEAYMLDGERVTLKED